VKLRKVKSQTKPRYRWGVAAVTGIRKDRKPDWVQDRTANHYTYMSTYTRNIETAQYL
jgi:hypothetical protein